MPPSPLDFVHKKSPNNLNNPALLSKTSFIKKYIQASIMLLTDIWTHSRIILHIMVFKVFNQAPFFVNLSVIHQVYGIKVWKLQNDIQFQTSILIWILCQKFYRNTEMMNGSPKDLDLSLVQCRTLMKNILGRPGDGSPQPQSWAGLSRLEPAWADISIPNVR